MRELGATGASKEGTSRPRTIASSSSVHPSCQVSKEIRSICMNEYQREELEYSDQAKASELKLGPFVTMG